MALIDYRALREEVPIRRILSLINYHPSSRRGAQWRGTCPLPDHPVTSSGDRSFSVNVQRNVYYCHCCRSGGNQLELWMAITQYEIHDAAIDLCQKLHLDPRQFLLIRNPKSTPSSATQTATPGTN